MYGRVIIIKTGFGNCLAPVYNCKLWDNMMAVHSAVYFSVSVCVCVCVSVAHLLSKCMKPNAKPLCAVHVPEILTVKFDCNKNLVKEKCVFRVCSCKCIDQIDVHPGLGYFRHWVQSQRHHSSFLSALQQFCVEPIAQAVKFLLLNHSMLERTRH